MVSVRDLATLLFCVYDSYSSALKNIPVFKWKSKNLQFAVHYCFVQREYGGQALKYLLYKLENLFPVGGLFFFHHKHY